jgi:hypothetical protein
MNNKTPTIDMQKLLEKYYSEEEPVILACSA